MLWDWSGDIETQLKEEQMLVLSRMRDQVIVLKVAGIEINLTLLDIRGDKCRLGFEAPGSVTINRAEVQAKIEAELAEAK